MIADESTVDTIRLDIAKIIILCLNDDETVALKRLTCIMILHIIMYYTLHIMYTPIMAAVTHNIHNNQNDLRRR